MSKGLKGLAKIIAKGLRHDPDGIAIQLTEEGWVSIDDLYTGLDLTQPFILEKSDIEKALIKHNHGRFDYDEKEGRVRARSGHTTEQVSYQASKPPEFLYWVVPERDRLNALEFGIGAENEGYVRLYEDLEELEEKTRINNPTFFRINTATAGTEFFYRDDQWWVKELNGSCLEVL